jgi:hypothetical protein
MRQDAQEDAGQTNSEDSRGQPDQQRFGEKLADEAAAKGMALSLQVVEVRIAWSHDIRGDGDVRVGSKEIRDEVADVNTVGRGQDIAVGKLPLRGRSMLLYQQMQPEA